MMMDEMQRSISEAIIRIVPLRDFYKSLASELGSPD